jgi:RimJ/RimL family protein N-acetyltransferase
VARAVAAGATRLWCLAENHRARRLYDRLGWRPTGVERAAEWPPHPVELEYAAG